MASLVRRPPRVPLFAEFSIGDRVRVVDLDLVGTVTGIMFSEVGTCYRVVWYCNGARSEQWVRFFELRGAGPCESRSS